MGALLKLRGCSGCCGLPAGPGLSCRDCACGHRRAGAARRGGWLRQGRERVRMHKSFVRDRMMDCRPLPALPTVNSPPGVPSPWCPSARLGFTLPLPGHLPSPNAGRLALTCLGSTAAWTKGISGIADDATLTALIPGHGMVGCQQFFRLLKTQRQAGCASFLSLTAVPRRLGCVSRRATASCVPLGPTQGRDHSLVEWRRLPRRGDGDGGRGAQGVTTPCGSVGAATARRGRRRPRRGEGGGQAGANAVADGNRSGQRPDRYM